MEKETAYEDPVTVSRERQVDLEMLVEPLFINSHILSLMG